MITRKSVFQITFAILTLTSAYQARFVLVLEIVIIMCRLCRDGHQPSDTSLNMKCPRGKKKKLLSLSIQQMCLQRRRSRWGPGVGQHPTFFKIDKDSLRQSHFSLLTSMQHSSPSPNKHPPPLGTMLYVLGIRS